jgi:hypothetical protein
MKVGSVVYATNQGLGHLAKSFFDAGVIDKVMIYRHPHGEIAAPTHREWYPNDTPVLIASNFASKVAERFLDDVDVMLFFETPFDWSFANRCHEREVKTVLIPMYEWFPFNPPHAFDLFLNPSALDQMYFSHGTHIPVPVDNDIKHTMRHTATRFLHNAGHIGSRNHKGTLELLRAMEFVQSPIQLTVRCQHTKGLHRLLHSSGINIDDPRLEIIDHEIPRGELFHADFDVYIAPEKYNGLSLPLQQAFASGMPVMTSDRFPHNTWLPNEILIPVSDTRNAQVMGGHMLIEESIITPRDIAQTIDDWYGKDITHLSQLGYQYAIDNSWEQLKPRYIEALKGVL